jgi:hypothetical protein
LNPSSVKNAVLPVALAIFLATLTVYLMTMPKSITLEDAGLFQMVCHEGGIGHPPGYPVFVLGCQAFVSLPFFDDSVFAANLLSALYAACACFLLVLVAHELTGDRVRSLVIAGIYGFSATFWSQAIIVEVYSLAVLLYLASLWFILVYRRTLDTRYLCFLAVSSGLALANHWPLHLLAAPSLLFVVLPVWRDFLAALKNPLTLASLLLLFLVGLSPYLSLLQSAPSFAVHGEVSSGDELLRYVSRSAYTDHSGTAGWEDRYQFQLWLWQQTLNEFSYYLVPMMLLGFFDSFRRMGVTLALSFTCLYLGATTLLVVLTGFEFNELKISVFKPYPVIAYIAPAIWTGLGTGLLLDAAGKHLPVAGRIAAPLLLILVLQHSFAVNNRSDDSFAERFALELLNRVPEGAVLFLEGDNTVGPVGYLHHVRGIRPDLELRSWNNLVFDNRLASPFASDARHQAARQAFIDTSDRPVYTTATHGEPSIHLGLVFELSRGFGYRCDEAWHGYIKELVDIAENQTLTDGHEKVLLSGILLELSRQHAGLLAFDKSAPEDELRILVDLQRTPEGLFALMEFMLSQVQIADARSILMNVAATARSKMRPGTSARIRAMLHQFDGRISMIEPEQPLEAVDHFRKSIEVYPVKENPSICMLYGIYEQTRRAPEAKHLLNRFGAQCD